LKTLVSNKKLLFWTKKSTLSILDQGVFAGGNFLLNLLLARWLKPEDYGVFALTYAIFLLLTAFHNSVLVEPVSVFGPKKYLNNLIEYKKNIVAVHFFLMTIFSILLCLPAFLITHFYFIELKRTMLYMLLSAPFILFFYLIRKTFYINLNLRKALFSSLLNLFLIMGLVYIMYKKETLLVEFIFPALAIASFFSGLLFSFNIKSIKKEINVVNIENKTIIKENWKYGKWILATSSLTWLSGNFYYIILPFWVGLSEVGALRAYLNLPLPAIHVITALSALFIPLMSKHLHEKGIQGVFKDIKIFLFIGFFLSVVFSLLLVLFDKEILFLLYKGKYENYINMIFIVALLPLLNVLIQAFASVLRVLEKTKYIFHCYIFSSIGGLVVGVILLEILGFEGAFWGMLVSYMISAGVLFISSYYSGIRKKND